MNNKDQNNPNWDDNSIQFPRLLSEICACQDNLDLDAISDSMDLKVEDVIELLDRSQSEWEKIKKKHCPIGIDCHGNAVESDPSKREQVYIKNLGYKCLYCLSKNIFGDPFVDGIDDDNVWCEVTCENCGREWRDVYVLDGIREN